MLVGEITPRLIKEYLHAFSQHRNPPDPLWSLHCLGGARSPAEQSIALNELVTGLVIAQLERLRPKSTRTDPEGLFRPSAMKGGERERALAQLTQDFHLTSTGLQGWSALYCRFLSPFSFSMGELAHNADVNERTFRRRVQDGLVYLTDCLRQAESNAHARPIHQDVPSPPADYVHLAPKPAHSQTMTAQAASGGNYYDDFSGYAIGAPPTGWFLRGSADVIPIIEEVGGSGPDFRVVSFPEVPWQYWDRWLIRDDLVLSGAYTITVKLSFLNEVADRAGLSFAWNAVNSDHIDVQPNLYWEHIEVHVKYSGPNPANVVVASTLRLSIKAFTDYWLKIAAKDYGPGRGQLQVFWSTDGRAFEQAVIVTGLPDLTGMAGISTAGPHLPHTHFDDFRVEWQ
jgi:hypothetical protein